MIERNGTAQIETDKRSGIKSEFTVEWVAECEYYLASVSDRSLKQKVKITRINANGYSCQAILGNSPHLYPSFSTYKRMADK
jgi:hypothetical protein